MGIFFDEFAVVCENRCSRVGGSGGVYCGLVALEPTEHWTLRQPARLFIRFAWVGYIARATQGRRLGDLEPQIFVALVLIFKLSLPRGGGSFQLGAETRHPSGNLRPQCFEVLGDLLNELVDSRLNLIIVSQSYYKVVVPNFAVMRRKRVTAWRKLKRSWIARERNRHFNRRYFGDPRHSIILESALELLTGSSNFIWPQRCNVEDVFS